MRNCVQHMRRLIIFLNCCDKVKMKKVLKGKERTLKIQIYI